MLNIKTLKMRKNIFHTLIGVAAIAVATTTYTSCNKPFEPTLQEDYGTDGGVSKTQKMLVIVVDGAVGLEVQKIQPPYISVLTDNSIYSWNGLTDTRKTPVTNALGWTSLLTGVNQDKHNVTGEDFTGNQLQQYPSVFSRLKQLRPEWRTAAYGASQAFITNLASDATEKTTFSGNDEAVADATLNDIATKDSRLIVAQFHDVDLAGQAGAYSEADAGYKAAVLKTDTYIRELVEALGRRSTYNLENWMIIVTSNKGSVVADDPVAADKLAYDDSRRNTFFVCYAPNLKVNYRPGSLPFSGNTPVYQGGAQQASKAQTLNAGSTLDIGASGSYTIECKVRIPTGNYYYPAILSKRASFSGGVVGWVFFLEANFWMVNFGQTGLGNRQIRGHAISDGKWHTLTVTIKQVDATTRRVETFTDGVYYDGGITDGTRNIHSYGNLNSPAPLTFGQLSGDDVTGLKNYNITDVKIYDTAFSREYIAANYCRTSHPQEETNTLDNLLAYWSCRDIAKVNVNGTEREALLAQSGKITDQQVLSNLAMPLSGSYGKTSFVEVVNGICPTPDANSYKVVPNSVDLVTQLMAWMGVMPTKEWGLDGSTWLTSYMNL